jgi:hypothetical protein
LRQNGKSIKRIVKAAARGALQPSLTGNERGSSMPAKPVLARPPEKIPPTSIPQESSAASLPAPPDLLALVARYGGFAKVPVEAWRAFDKRLAKYKAALRRC